LFDAAPYKKKAGDTIKVLYPKIIHEVTCLEHGLHRISELVRVHYPRADKLVSSVNQVFLKASSQTVLFKTVNPGNLLLLSRF